MALPQPRVAEAINQSCDNFIVGGALQPVFGVRVNPCAQCPHGDAPRCTVARRWQFTATQHRVNRRAAVARQACSLDHVDLQGFEVWLWAIVEVWRVAHLRNLCRGIGGTYTVRVAYANAGRNTPPESELYAV
jgi:hypothetical protein